MLNKPLFCSVTCNMREKSCKGLIYACRMCRGKMLYTLLRFLKVMLMFTDLVTLIGFAGFTMIVVMYFQYITLVFLNEECIGLFEKAEAEAPTSLYVHGLTSSNLTKRKGLGRMSHAGLDCEFCGPVRNAGIL